VAKKVLIADDHAPTVALIRDALTPHGYEVLSAENGAECVARVAECQPDLLLLDVQMPVLNGLDAFRLVRRQSEAGLPVIMLSGRGELADVRAAWKGGADLYLTKPVRVAAVVAAVKWLLREEEAIPVPATAGDPALLGAVVASDLS
jgi:DNA-binding response OmpR family regulator